MNIINIEFSENEGLFLLRLTNNKSYMVSYDFFEKNQLALGGSINNDLLSSIEYEDEYFRAKKSVLNYLSYRLRSGGEIRKHLSSKYSQQIIEKILSDLTNQGLLNDHEFAEKYVRDKVRMNHYGPIRIRQELLYKGISSEYIDQAITAISYDEYLEAAKEILIRKNLFPTHGDLKRRKKIYNQLQYRGFDYDIIQELINNWEDYSV